jgi:protoporphyrinogen oxidase
MTYWLNVCDTQAPVLAIVEHTNFMNKSHYNNEHLLYLGNYLPMDHRYFSMTPQALLKEFNTYLQKIRPQYDKHILGIKKFTAPFAQPIIPVNYSKKVPPFETPLQNVYLANIQQVYPWDRGTNYAVELGEKIAGLITK